MQTISTKFLAPTTHKGARIRATNTMNADAVLIDGISSFRKEDHAHAHAAALLMRKVGWDKEHNLSKMVGGHTKNGMVWVFEHGSPEISSWTLRKLELEKNYEK